MTNQVHENAELLAKRRETVELEVKRRKKIRAVNQWAVIKKIEDKDKLTEGGVILAGSSRSQTGIVISCSEKVEIGNGYVILAPCKVGDEVIFTNFPIELEDLERLTGDKNLMLVRWEEIYGVVEPVESENADQPRD